MEALATLADLDAFERKVSGVLGRYGLAHGVYDETENATEWLAQESIDVAHCLQSGMDPTDILYSTGYLDPENEFPVDDLRRDLLALGNGSTGDGAA